MMNTYFAGLILLYNTFMFLTDTNAQFNKEVKIGKQAWTSKNLDICTIQNVDAILDENSKEDWRKARNSIKLAYCYYEYDANTGKSTASFTNNKPKETTIVLNNDLKTIDIYSKFIRVLKYEFVKIKNNLIDNDEENYFKIRNYIYSLLDNKRNVDPKLIKDYVSFLGSNRYLNEYKCLFFYMFDFKYLLSSCPDEIVYTLDDNGRILYFEARNIFKGGDTQIFDRSLLQRFIITKKNIKDQYHLDF